MSEKSNKFENNLTRLIDKGDLLHTAFVYEFNPDMVERQIKKAIGKEKVANYISSLPNFKSEYQAWYSEASSLISQVLPDRISDFKSHYEYPRVRKDISFQNYMIRDYLQGLRITRGYEKTLVVDGSAAAPEFEQQVNILKAARSTLKSWLIDLKFVLQADLFDSEIDSARAIAKNGFLRPAGAICGVVLEKHLREVCGVHGIVVRKKSPGISNFNQSLRDKDVVTISQWRFVQHLADIRNVCDHDKGREPTTDEIEDLLIGTDKVLKTIF